MDINAIKKFIKDNKLKVENQFYKDLHNRQFLVISSRNEDNPENFDNVIPCTDLEEARTYIKWNYEYLARIINLETLQVIEESRKLIRPTLKDICNG